MQMTVSDCNNCDTCIGCGLNHAKHFYCDGCGMEMSGSEKVYHVSGYDDRWLCVDCKDELIEQIVTVCFVGDILGGCDDAI